MDNWVLVAICSPPGIWTIRYLTVTMKIWLLEQDIKEKEKQENDSNP